MASRSVGAVSHPAKSRPWSSDGGDAAGCRVRQGRAWAGRCVWADGGAARMERRVWWSGGGCVAPLLDQPSWGSGRFKKRGCRSPRGLTGRTCSTEQGRAARRMDRVGVHRVQRACNACMRQRRRRRCRRSRPSGLLVVHLWVQFSKIMLPSMGGPGTSAGGGRRRRNACAAAVLQRGEAPARPALPQRLAAAAGRRSPAGHQRLGGIPCHAPPLGGGGTGRRCLMARGVDRPSVEWWRGGRRGEGECPSAARPSGMGCSRAGQRRHAPAARSEHPARSIGGHSPRPERPHSAARPRPAPRPLRPPRRAGWQPPRSPAPAPCLGWGCAPHRRPSSSTRPPSSSSRRCGASWAIAGGRSQGPGPAHAALGPPPSLRSPSPARRRSGRRSVACRCRSPPAATLQPAHAPHVQVCRCLPWVVDNYRLDELTTVPELRRNLAAMFRKYTDVQVGAHALVTCTARPKLCRSASAGCTRFCLAVAVAGGGTAIAHLSRSRALAAARISMTPPFCAQHNWCSRRRLWTC